MTAFIFPGQGSQYEGMGKFLLKNFPGAKSKMDEADKLLGFHLSSVMMEGNQDELKATRVAQPAIFLHSIIEMEHFRQFHPVAVAGHSLGEFTALVASGVMKFSDALSLILIRAEAMQRACEANISTMAAVLGMADETVERICNEIHEEIVVAANYNCPGQVVISGTLEGVELAGQKLKDAGAKRVVILPVAGAFHSPLMESAREELESALEKTSFYEPFCPVYQNVDGKPYHDPHLIKENLIHQLTEPVRWTQTILAMQKAGINRFLEFGPGNVLQGLVKKIVPDAEVMGAEILLR